MAFYNGYVTLPVTSYSAWKNAVIGNGYDADGYYGAQCWDLCAEFWWNIGFPQGYPITGPNSYASECWTVNRETNKSYNGTQYFDLIYNATDIKRGDVVVFAGSPGHIGFADSDYTGGTYISILGQNQGSSGTPTPIPHPNGGTTANVTNLNASSILGAFRYREWGGGPTPPTPTRKRGKFPWVLYARKLRTN